MRPSRVRRHLWHVDDACCVCGVRRDGYQGGRTGSLRFTWPDGRVTTSGGECPGPPATELLDDDGVWVDTGVPASPKVVASNPKPLRPLADETTEEK